MVSTSLILQAARSLPAAYRKPDNESCFLGYTATKRLGKAFIRNRTKRRLRAAAREIFPTLALPSTDYVLIGRYCTKDVPFEQLKTDMKTALKRINKIMRQKEKSSSDETQPDD